MNVSASPPVERKAREMIIIFGLYVKTIIEPFKIKSVEPFAYHQSERGGL
jgi:hypothetical protein